MTQKNKNIPVIGDAPLSEPSKDAKVVGIKRTIDIDNSNKERLKHGMPLKGRTVNPTTGKEEEVAISYTPEQAGMSAEAIAALDSNVKDEDISEQKKRDWKL